MKPLLIRQNLDDKTLILLKLCCKGGHQKCGFSRSFLNQLNMMDVFELVPCKPTKYCL